MNCYIVWSASDEMVAVWAENESDLVSKVKIWVPGATKWQDLGNGAPYGYARIIAKPDQKIIPTKQPEQFTRKTESWVGVRFLD